MFTSTGPDHYSGTNSDPPHILNDETVMRSPVRLLIGIFLLIFVATAGCGDPVETPVDDQDAGWDAEPAPSCDDGEMSGEQTDVDCGGPNCDPCDIGQNCQSDDDCLSGDCDDGVCVPGPCDNIECNDDQTCYRGVCYDNCVDDADCDDDDRCYDEQHCAPLDCEGIECDDGETCYQGVCYDTCIDDADCSEQEACLDGACVDPCETVDCPDDQTCYRGVCYDTCSDDADCGADDRCYDAEHCAPPDCDDVDCLDTETCYRGVCYPSCAEDADCDDENACVDSSCIDLCDDADCSDDTNCYMGECYDTCDDDADCSDGSQCQDGMCMPTDCGGIDCLDYQTCYNGVCYDTCIDDEDCIDEDAVCDDSACVPDCYDDDEGDQICPELDFDTLDADEVTDDSATLHAVIDELPLLLPSDHGFCWSTDEDPGTDDADCYSLGEPTTAEEFSHQVDSLTAGTTYHVRAYVQPDQDDDTEYGDEVSFTTSAPVPEDVEASEGEYDDHVQVSWEGVDGADEYRVFRDGDEIATVDATSFEDTSADEPDELDAPGGLTATDGIHTDRVELSWDGVQVDDATRHDYEVAAVFPDTESATSDEVEGWRAAPDLEEYTIYRDGDQIATVDADTTDYSDTGADSPTVDAGEASASDGEYTDHVAVELLNYSSDPGAPSTYWVRAVTEDDTSDASSTEEGHIGVGDIEVKWQRSSSDANSDYSDISGATSASYDDTDAPDDGSGRYWRAVVNADGATEQVSDADRGYRAAFPQVVTDQPDNISNTSATLHGEIEDLGAPDPTAHGFCIDTDPDPDLNDSCEDLGSTDSEGPFDETVDDLNEGTEYYVRAFATNDAGTAYGDSVEFSTPSETPTNLTASEGDSSDYVELEWTGTDGADEYRIYRDDIEIATVSSTSYDDTGADEGDAPDAPTLNATEGDHTDRVELSWDEPTVDDGTSHDYHVIAVSDGGDSDPSNTDTGWRAGYEIDEYTVFRDSDQIATVTATEHTDTDADEPSVQPGEADASEGDYEDYVALELLDADTEPGDEHTYEVRAINDTATGDPGEDQGHIGVGDLDIQWQRSADDSDADYYDISGATSQTYNDEDAPDDGSGRYYRAIVNANGAPEQISTSDRGWRATAPSMSPNKVFTGSTDETVRKIDGDGDQVWPFTDHDDTVLSVATDPDGYVYTASFDDTARKLDSDGNELWSFPHDDSVYDIAVDDEGYVYTAASEGGGGGGPAGGGGVVYKLDSDGNEQWSFTDPEGIVQSVAVDTDGYVYLGDRDDRVYKLDSDGNEQWTFTGHDDWVYGVAVDPDGYVYTASADETVRKLDSDGDEQWSYGGYSGTVADVAVDPDGYVYTASADETVRKLDSNGNEQWSFTGHSDTVYDVAVNPDGRVYTASWDETARKLDSNGNELWSFTNHSDDVDGVTVEPGIYGAFPGEW